MEDGGKRVGMGLRMSYHDDHSSLERPKTQVERRRGNFNPHLNIPVGRQTGCKVAVHNV